MSKHRHIRIYIHPRRRNFGKLVNQREPHEFETYSDQKVYKLEGKKKWVYLSHM